MEATDLIDSAWDYSIGRPLVLKWPPGEGNYDMKGSDVHAHHHEGLARDTLPQISPI